ncbi:MAG: pilin [Patescibacteria group bacterium]
MKIAIIVSAIAVLLVAPAAVTHAQNQGGLIPVTPLPGMASGELAPAIQGIANAFLILAGITALIFLTLAGVRYITSGDSESGQEKAKHQIIYAVIGLIVIGLAAAIVNFTINAIQGRGSGTGGGINIPGGGGVIRGPGDIVR